MHKCEKKIWFKEWIGAWMVTEVVDQNGVGE